MISRSRHRQAHASYFAQFSHSLIGEIKQAQAWQGTAGEAAMRGEAVNIHGPQELLLIFFLIALTGCGGGSTLSASGSPSGPPSNPPGDSPPAATISISPASETLRTGGERQFSG